LLRERPDKASSMHTNSIFSALALGAILSRRDVVHDIVGRLGGASACNVHIAGYIYVRSQGAKLNARTNWQFFRYLCMQAAYTRH
jgi:hypothetical protein